MMPEIWALLFRLDGKIPNIALMRLAAYRREHGTVEPRPRTAAGMPIPDPWRSPRAFRRRASAGCRALSHRSRLSRVIRPLGDACPRARC